jgi:hypothetical protein
VALGALLAPHEAGALPIRVRGEARLFAQAQFVEGGVLELRGRLADDAGLGLEAAAVRVSSPGRLEVARGAHCRGRPLRLEVVAGALAVTTGAGGELCVRFPEAPERGTLALRFAGDALHGGAELDLDFDHARPRRLDTTLRFEPRPQRVELDRAEAAFGATLALAALAAHASREGLAVELRDARGVALAEARTSGDGKARLVVASRRLGGAGSAVLRLTFGGSDELGPASDEVTVTLVAAVHLGLERMPDAVVPGDEAELAVTAEVRNGPADGGVVEALASGESVTSGPVRAGRAILRVPIPRDATAPLPVELRYLPAAPHYVPTPSLALTLPIRAPSPWMRLLLSAAVLVAAGWVFASWRRRRLPAKLRDLPPPLAPGVRRIGRAAGAGTWHGVVVDAHDGRPIRGATLVVRVPTLGREEPLVRVTADAEGRFRFSLPPGSAGARGRAGPSGAELVVRAPRHSDERCALPVAAELRIAMTTRRRAVLERLVRWARRRGVPFDARPDPTPGHVRAAASATDVAEWAAAVEVAAYGPGEVDESVERHLRDGEPRGEPTLWAPPKEKG